jgi:hypothetical protein
MRTCALSLVQSAARNRAQRHAVLSQLGTCQPAPPGPLNASSRARSAVWTAPCRAGRVAGAAARPARGGGRWALCFAARRCLRAATRPPFETPRSAARSWRLFVGAAARVPASSPVVQPQPARKPLRFAESESSGQPHPRRVQFSPDPALLGGPPALTACRARARVWWASRVAQRGGARGRLRGAAASRSLARRPPAPGGRCTLEPPAPPPRGSLTAAGRMACAADDSAEAGACPASPPRASTTSAAPGAAGAAAPGWARRERNKWLSVAGLLWLCILLFVRAPRAPRRACAQRLMRPAAAAQQSSRGGSAARPLPSLRPLPPATAGDTNATLSFLVFGDWGRQGAPARAPTRAPRNPQTPPAERRTRARAHAPLTRRAAPQASPARRRWPRPWAPRQLRSTRPL